MVVHVHMVNAAGILLIKHDNEGGIIMCLATAFANRNGEETVVAQYVAAVELREGKVLLTGIMGEETEVEGILKSVDLTKNVVEISCPA